MTIPIVRMYETEQKARDAVGKLREEGFIPDTIHLITPVSKGEADTIEPVSIAIRAGFLPEPHAAVYAEGIQQGRSLVSIFAPFGHGQLATQILDGCSPVDTGLEGPQGRSIAWEEGAPLSSAFMLPTLWRNKPAPFSTVFGLEMLSSGRSFQSPRYKELANSDFALFGRSRLSPNPTPLSSLFHLKTISVKGGPSWTKSFGYSLLSQNPAPLSSKLGMHLLAAKVPHHHPAPFSEHLGIPTLSRGLSFLSRWFPAQASSGFAFFGRNPLISNPEPLSSLFGFKTLSDAKGPWEKSFGQPLLMEGSKPVSSKLGLPLLT